MISHSTISLIELCPGEMIKRTANGANTYCLNIWAPQSTSRLTKLFPLTIAKSTTTPT